VDATDLAIVRALYPNGIWVPWGIDPRITPGQLGRQLRMGRTAVWSRIRHWEKSGFFRPYEIRPNYALFGVGLQRVDLLITDPVDAKNVLDELELVDGVTSAWVGFGDTDLSESVERVSVSFVDDGPSAVDRRMRLLRRLSTRRRVDGPFAYRLPIVGPAPTALDWRIMSALRTNPRASLATVARVVGITAKTLGRHRDALLDSRALWYLPLFDWGLHPSVNLRIYWEEMRPLSSLLAAVETRFPRFLPMSLVDMGYRRPGEEGQVLCGVRIPTPSPDAVQKLMIELSDIPGVVRVRSDFQGPWRFYSRWIDQELSGILANGLMGYSQRS
jgi:DNA-binding Lrp family transcriptional regulator